MRRKLTLLGVLLTLASIAALAPTAAAGAAPVTFNLTPPNFAMAPSGPMKGDTIRTTGSGAFDPSAGSILGSGSFTITQPNGATIARGTWAATAFVSFVAFGGPRNGLQGGQMFFKATLSPDGGSPQTGVPMSITCLRGTIPPGFTEDEGTTVGDFTDKTGGTTVFHTD